MFELLGDSPDAAGRNAATVMAIETRLAHASSIASIAATRTSSSTRSTASGSPP